LRGAKGKRAGDKGKFLTDSLSKDLLKRGFRFVGSTICYAFMQAVGMVNDHTVECFRYAQLSVAESSE
jgi:3-methyladenine DNA glycosylase Tag